MKNGEGTERVWLRIATAAALIDVTPSALRKRLTRLPVPPGMVSKFGASILINREAFLAWVASGAAVEENSCARTIAP